MKINEGDPHNSEDSCMSSSSSSHDSLENSHSTQPPPVQVDRAVSLSHRETRMVSNVKILFLLFMGNVAISFGIMTYITVKTSELQSFRHLFIEMAQDVVLHAREKVASTVDAVSGLSSSVTSITLALHKTFPNVTVPDFDHHVKLNNRLSQAVQVSFAPLVHEANRHAWQAYAHSKSERVVFTNDSYRTQAATAVYAPLWQQYPPTSTFMSSSQTINLLSHSAIARAFHGAWNGRHSTFSEITNLDFIYHSNSSQPGVSARPHGLLLEPVYESLGSHHNHTMVGLLVAIVPWDAFVSGVFTTGLVLVWHDSCGVHHYTYQTSESNVIFVGDGDLHDIKYEALHAAIPTAKATTTTSSTSGLGYYSSTETLDRCEYTLRVYPSSSMEEQFTSSKPFWYSLVVILIFGSTILIFFLFDFAVTQRQKKLEATATQSHAIVSSLFPANVRDRMLEDASRRHSAAIATSHDTIFTGGDESAAKWGRRIHKTNTGRLQESVTDGGQETIENTTYSKPIAELYPDCTVMFADIVGFTAWSSDRSPTDVFGLLETVYHAFDEIAKLRRVFKVETIGDCYVAVAGLPESRSDHAVVMARFSRDCLQRMNVLTQELMATLGPETGNLSMRFGLHSGPVTAGVLRGEKGRFQLFGDTVNMAARMESNGARNRIHCSQETACLLTKAGKTWACPREDLVHAKGKGEVQTFWIDFTKRSNRSESAAGSSNRDEEDPIGTNVINDASEPLVATSSPSSCRSPPLDNTIVAVESTMESTDAVADESVSSTDENGHFLEL